MRLYYVIIYFVNDQLNYNNFFQQNSSKNKSKNIWLITENDKNSFLVYSNKTETFNSIKTKTKE